MPQPLQSRVTAVPLPCKPLLTVTSWEHRICYLRHCATVYYTNNTTLLFVFVCATKVPQ